MEKEPSAVVNLVAYSDNEIPRAIELFYALLSELQERMTFEGYIVTLDAIQAILNCNVEEKVC